MKVGIPSKHYLDARPPGCPNCLPVALVMPSIHQHCIILAFSKDFSNFGGVEAGKPAVAWWVRYIAQECVRIPFQQRNIPIKGNSKSRPSLFLGCSPVAVIHMHS